MSIEDDIKYMRLAIDEANKSIPIDGAYCVGCVIVRNDEIISTGYSRELPGNTHAEQVALMKINYEANDTILYTTMEPCSKRLSGNKPCVENCLLSNVTRVVIGVLEPKNFVACEGREQLQNAGVIVDILQGLEEECLAPNQHLNLQLDS